MKASLIILLISNPLFSLQLFHAWKNLDTDFKTDSKNFPRYLTMGKELLANLSQSKISSLTIINLKYNLPKEFNK